MEFQVIWSIEVDAESFEEAVQLALEIQRDPYSLATHFQVKDESGVVREVTIRMCPSDEETDDGN